MKQKPAKGRSLRRLVLCTGWAAVSFFPAICLYGEIFAGNALKSAVWSATLCVIQFAWFKKENDQVSGRLAQTNKEETTNG